MKTSASFLLCFITATCFAQNSTSLLFSYLNKPVDVNSCYNATPLVSTLVDKGKVLLMSTNGGTTWEDLTVKLPEGIQVSSGFVKDGEMYLGTYDGKLYHSADPANGPWELQKIENNIQLEGSVFGIFECKSGLYVSIFQNGFYRNEKGTNVWKSMHENLEEKTVHSVIETEDGAILVATVKGVYRSTDDCKTWKLVYEGWTTSLNAQSNLVLASGAKGLIRSTDHGKTWECMLNDPGSVYKMRTIGEYFIAIRLAGPWRSATEHERWISISKDGGNTWQKMDPGNPADAEVNDITKLGDYLFSSRKAGLSRSNDMGKTWQLVLSPATTDGLIFFDMLVADNNLFAIVKMGGC